ncbi:hypothetical protein [[Flexibacter] sp. ATCC 35103]|uniref:hypothetical protein n=1 Tax=[Flexibacter] sp. ATCC 35103 TaxID=1937528 RepID=UPI0009D39BAA|nr:hypothetical protein [[Flexibacter] sp. ATCC 35103]OMQ08690.1 hypothetical protein BXU01_20050 [[Flexibacter] sp. ATCC 35103]
MNFELIDIRKVDSTGNFKLNEDYILSYDHSDGWSERLLSLGIYIDLIFECKIVISFRRKNFENFEKQFECEIPSEIKNIISEIINLDPLTLKKHYADTFMEDMNRQHYAINHSGKSHNIGIGTLLKRPQPENPSEELFITLIDLFEKWREVIYQDCLKNII